jgi:hypothetical protein
VACLAAALVPWLVATGPWAILASFACAAMVFAGFVSCGWLGGSAALASASLSSGGVWWLVGPAGSGEEARLLPDSRVFARWLWLRWDGPSGRRHAILLRDAGQADAVRRLATRLRLQGTRPAAGSDSLPL